MSDLSPCCSRPFSRVTVTSSGQPLTLASCTACGTHQWEGGAGGSEGIVGRDAMLDAMRTTGVALKGKRTSTRA